MLTINYLTILKKFPYLAILLTIIIFTIRGIAKQKAKEYNTTGLKYEEYLAIVIAWINEKKLAGILPFMSLFGVGQYLAPNSATGGKSVVVITNILLVLILCAVELWYGHLGIIIFFLICILTYTFAYTFQTLGCNNEKSKNKNNIFTQQLATGTFIIVFFAAAVVNILFSFGQIGIISGIVLHLGIFGMLFGLDYKNTFKNTSNDNEKLCYTFLNHSFGYLLGLIISLFILFTSINITVSKPIPPKSIKSYFY
jgi:hypothetical protein